MRGWGPGRSRWRLRTWGGWGSTGGLFWWGTGGGGNGGGGGGGGGEEVDDDEGDFGDEVGVAVP